MRVLIEDEVFGCPQVPELTKFALLDAGKERHVIEIVPPYQPRDQTRALSRWLSEQSRQAREECALALNAGLRSTLQAQPRVTIRVTVPGRERPEENPLLFAPEEAKAHLQMSFNVLVENRFRDGEGFLKTMMRALPDQEDGLRRTLLRYLDKRWLQFEHAGGDTGIPTTLQEALKEPGGRLRRFVVHDSDGRAPNETSASADKVRALCAEHNFPSHTLQRRAIENYLPVPILQQWAATGLNPAKLDEKPQSEAIQKRIACVAALERLTRKQRAHYNLKEGFGADQEGGINDLFKELDEELWAPLKDGVHKRIAFLFCCAETFPIDPVWLEDDGCFDEFLPVFRELRKSL